MQTKKQRLAPSWFNLREVIPIRDLRQHFYRQYLDAGDFLMGLLAHGCSPRKSIARALSCIILNEYTWLLTRLAQDDIGRKADILYFAKKLAPRYGKISALTWIRATDPTYIYPTYDLVMDAAKYGHISILQWVNAIDDISKYAMSIAMTAIDAYQVVVIEWIFDFDKHSTAIELEMAFKHACFVGAMAGNIPLLQWVLSKNILDYRYTARILFQGAMDYSNIEAFKWLTENILVRPDINFYEGTEKFRALY
jgi:hypothetical protein